MFGLETLDILIGLITIYLVFGMACTAIVEAVAAVLKSRSANLELALQEFFAGKLNETTPFVKAFFDHPLVQMLSLGKDGRPSYIPPEIVGQVVESLLTARGTVTSLKDAVNALPETPDTNRIKGVLQTLVTEAGNDVAVFRQLVESHFNATMERASGWFKRHTQIVGLVAATLLVLAANVDTVVLAKSLALNSVARVKMVEVAERNVQAAGSDAQATAHANAALKDAVSTMAAGGLQLGWSGFATQATLDDWLTKLAGLLVSVFAVSLGAPFWFDILQRFMQVRAAGASPKEVEERKKS